MKTLVQWQDVIVTFLCLANFSPQPPPNDSNFTNVVWAVAFSPGKLVMRVLIWNQMARKCWWRLLSAYSYTTLPTGR